MRDAIDQMLPANLLSCEALIERVNSRWEQDKDDVNKITRYYYSMRIARDSSGNSCLETKEYEMVVRRLYELAPSSELAEQVAVYPLRRAKRMKPLKSSMRPLRWKQMPIRKAASV